MRTKFSIGLLFFVSAAGCVIPAVLPLAQSVPQSESLPIDGLWRLTASGVTYRIEMGRIYATQAYMAGPFAVAEGMVVVRDLEARGPRSYTGTDLSLAGPWTGTLHSDGTIHTQTKTPLGPASFVLQPLQPADPVAFQAALSAPDSGAGNDAPAYGPPGYTPPPAYGEPAPGYGAPPPAYGSPPPGYGSPAPIYGSPAPTYGSPPPGYGAPDAGYLAPPAAQGPPAPGPGAEPPPYGVIDPLRDGARIALRTSDGAYLVRATREGRETVEAAAGMRANDHHFQVASQGDAIALQASNGRFLALVPRGGAPLVEPSRTRPDADTRLQVVVVGPRRLALRASNGKFLTPVPRGEGRALEASAEVPDGASTFTLESL